MKIIGITGGIGTGKSAVLNILEREHSAYVLEADKLAHKLMEPGEVSYNDIVKAFGEDILSEGKSIDRAKLGKIVFADEEKLNVLNRITHPNVKSAILSSIKEQERQNCQLYVIEAALLIQEGYRDICQEMWYVYAPLEVRVDRLCRYRDFSRDRALSVIAAQESEDYYRENCDIEIDNSKGLEELRVQIGRILSMDR
jgi:dephospho-CoA kinase